ncbi:hypothetical protein CSUIS_0547 [Campylobacter porcelli]|uniref:Uncharacterized protein n=1 Tax=Campylobacter porcelli TaxID=1660073 RepID=A0A1X9SVN9_9BACT|nr:hypothetical protein CSUIS_0547 [Campylobacter sp. RM6137]
MTHLKPRKRGTPIFAPNLYKNPWRSHPLKGFYRGLGVVKGEGVAAAKKALPFPLKLKNYFNFAAEQNPTSGVPLFCFTG